METTPAKVGRKPTGAKPVTISLLPQHIEMLKNHLAETGQSYSETIRHGIEMVIAHDSGLRDKAGAK